eukprot:1573496-Pleurochrysis_carterae.AAC.1
MEDKSSKIALPGRELYRSESLQDRKNKKWSYINEAGGEVRMDQRVAAATERRCNQKLCWGERSGERTAQKSRRFGAVAGGQSGEATLSVMRPSSKGEEREWRTSGHVCERACGCRGVTPLCEG